MTGKSVGCFGIVFLIAFALMGSVPVNEIDQETILKTTPEWQENYDNYIVAEPILKAIAGKTTALSIEVYLGTWCSDSRQNVPLFIKILMALKNSGLTVKFFNVGKKADATLKYYVDEVLVERVPTFIFYRDGMEIGRIIENPVKTMAEDFLDIIS